MKFVYSQTLFILALLYFHPQTTAVEAVPLSSCDASAAELAPGQRCETESGSFTLLFKAPAGEVWRDEETKKAWIDLNYNPEPRTVPQKLEDRAFRESDLQANFSPWFYLDQSVAASECNTKEMRNISWLRQKAKIMQEPSGLPSDTDFDLAFDHRVDEVLPSLRGRFSGRHHRRKIRARALEFWTANKLSSDAVSTVPSSIVHFAGKESSRGFDLNMAADIFVAGSAVLLPAELAGYIALERLTLPLIYSYLQSGPDYVGVAYSPHFGIVSVPRSKLRQVLCVAQGI